jgi:Holliday junction resolvase-like predicted endonuclease
MSISKKTLWYRGESVAIDHYLRQWYELSVRNYTIRGWEIDCVVENAVYRRYIEVKVVEYVVDLQNYITPKKLRTLIATIRSYATKFPTTKLQTIDVVFVQQNTILHLFEDITL